MKKIVLINFFFGEFPWYFNFFLKTCETNESVDILIFTDNVQHQNLPSNVKQIHFTLQQFNKLASEKLGFNISVERPYKFCDFKPCFGEIFFEYIKEYDFWALCDIDLVFGRIREFITDEMLNFYDVISVRHDYPTGFFMLFKNTREINNLFRKSKDYKKILTSKNNYCFDECNYKYRYLEEGMDILDLDCEIESMHHVLKKEESLGNIKVHFDFLVIEGTPGKLLWNHGILTYDNKFEVLLYHFVSFKYNLFARENKYISIPNKFFIDKYNIRFSEKKLLSFFWINFMYPLLYNGFKAFDRSISKILKIKFRKKLKEGRYYLGESTLDIKKNNNSFSASFEDLIDEPLCKMVLSKNTFFIDKYPYFFRCEKNSDNLFNRLIEVRKDGNTSIFDCRNNK